MTVTTDRRRYTLITAFIRVHLWSQCSAIFFMPKRVIIDTDPGVDDALALILALQSPELCVEAITTVSGNVHVNLATQNALTVVGLFPPERRPPVVTGVDRPLARPLYTAAQG